MYRHSYPYEINIIRMIAIVALLCTTLRFKFGATYAYAHLLGSSIMSQTVPTQITTLQYHLGVPSVGREKINRLNSGSERPTWITPFMHTHCGICSGRYNSNRVAPDFGSSPETDFMGYHRRHCARIHF